MKLRVLGAAPVAPDDAHWMALALAEARAAGAAGEVPVGAVLIRNGELVATGRNAPVASHDPSAHAEIAALRAGAAALGNYRLDGCELFVTLEPCAMCAGAILHARLARVVYGAADLKTGAAGSVVDLFAQPRLNHRTVVQRGVLADECAQLLQSFFQDRRVAARESAQPLRDDALRTPEASFAQMAPPERFAARYVSDLPALGGWRMHYLDEGPPASSPTVLCLHGPGQWSHGFRHLVAQPGVRWLAPDLVGCGRSDKPKRDAVHRWTWHRDVLLAWLDRCAPASPVLLAPAPGAEPLAALLEAAAPGRFVGTLAVPDAFDGSMDGAWRAPFPDRGYEAALRALGAAPPRSSGPDAAQAAQWLDRAMGYFPA
ncbi:tRNA adenosine(34) deaminase TadA [Variovorax sp. N23]|nr:tRNA adenosine(34) deaminase TadA [Variovorax sp. N23]MCU4119925.1 tRNA adenosine(34) deaminase TadA [Variovorax sp. N23]